ncbi:hypothetical protein DFH08DRAFT_819375 [Mycena albidolilacea]|uniref:Uncharacterized protein n=1 Tax=Mycena albidolilacea TaxID=1033008 RepID=A0AAD7EFU4_9AGAR|nr:hypothetical protein DFH08DRAFT_819375 [Mycena albidolilacea]
MCAHADEEEFQDAKQNLAEAQAQLKLAQAEQKSNSSGRMRVSRPRKRKRASNSEQPKSGFPKLSADSLLNLGRSSESTNPSQTAAFVEDDTSATLAQPPRKRLKLDPLKGWGVQRDGIAISAADYAKNYWDEFKEDYPEAGNRAIQCQNRTWDLDFNQASSRSRRDDLQLSPSFPLIVKYNEQHIRHWPSLDRRLPLNPYFQAVAIGIHRPHLQPHAS